MASNVLIDNHKQEILTLLRDGTALLTKIGDEARAQRLRQIQQETEDKKSPAIMFYGLYNAGKSTIINALFQKEISATGDVPTTTRIQEVPWEGYTLIDTPGIDARAKDTEIAENEIRRSDVVLFVMDNADTFDNAIVYQAIVDILKTGKPLAIVINQKNVEDDEDPNISVPDRKSIRTIVGKVSSNLETQGAKDGMQIVGKLNNFLGIFPVNALTAFNAGMVPGEDGEILYRASGILSLRNAMNESIRRSQYVYMLRTPLINLRDVLCEAIKSYQNAAIYGEKQQLAENREHLLESRQRLRDRLMADGLRKIEAIIEQAKADAANNKDVSGLGERINSELANLVKTITGEEQKVLQEKLSVHELQDYEHTELSAYQHSADKNKDNGDAFLEFGTVALTIPPITIPAIPIPINVIIAAIAGLVGVLSKLFSEDEPDPQSLSQEQYANYYKWCNELRDYELQVKATYEKSIDDFLRQYYDAKLNELDQALAEVDSNCAEHTKNLRAMEQLLLRVGDEMIALPEVM